MSQLPLVETIFYEGVPRTLRKPNVMIVLAWLGQKNPDNITGLEALLSWQPTAAAAAASSQGSAQILLEAGVDVDERGRYQVTPLKVYRKAYRSCETSHTAGA